MQILRIPGWCWPSYERAEFYGRRHSLAIGPLLIFWGQMTESEVDAWQAANLKRNTI